LIDADVIVQFVVRTRPVNACPSVGVMSTPLSAAAMGANASAASERTELASARCRDAFLIDGVRST
jgi:hypothetical protein